MLHRRWFPDHIDGTQVVLRRHTRDNLSDFLRWYQDPEVARLTRYQDGPMRPDEIERFFTMRAMGPDSLAMGIHLRPTGRIIGSCAFKPFVTACEMTAWRFSFRTSMSRF